MLTQEKEMREISRINQMVYAQIWIKRTALQNPFFKHAAWLHIKLVFVYHRTIYAFLEL